MSDSFGPEATVLLRARQTTSKDIPSSIHGLPPDQAAPMPILMVANAVSVARKNDFFFEGCIGHRSQHQ